MWLHREIIVESQKKAHGWFLNESKFGSSCRSETESRLVSIIEWKPYLKRAKWQPAALTQAFHCSTQEAEAIGSLWVRGPLELHWEFLPTQSYTGRSHLKTEPKNRKSHTRDPQVQNSAVWNTGSERTIWKEFTTFPSPHAGARTSQSTEAAETNGSPSTHSSKGARVGRTLDLCL